MLHIYSFPGKSKYYVWNDIDSMKMSGLEQGFDCFMLGFCVWCSRPLAYNTSTSQLTMTDPWALPLGIWNQYCLWWCLGICISASGKVVSTASFNRWLQFHMGLLSLTCSLNPPVIDYCCYVPRMSLIVRVSTTWQM